MIKSFKSYLKSKKGMTLVELLTAMTILMLMIFCFAPLMLSYLQTINISGEKMSKVQTESGILQVLLGGGVAKDGYTIPVNEVPMKLTSPAATVNGASVATATVESNVVAYGLSSRGTQPGENGIVNLDGGYTTITTDELGSGSGIRLFPASLTDDFQKAYITIYGNGINFTLSDCELSATGLTKEIELTPNTDYKLEYHPDADPGQTNMLLLTVYGGGEKVSFETSPLLFKHSGQIYEIQVDAPSMIMVGEKSLVADDKGNQYHYYVSRGEIDDDGDLLIHRRVMNTTDDELDSSVTGSTPIKLTSAMNDVEWVPVESADNHSKETSDGDTYGYYVMCGDQGQVRRFWKRPSTTVKVDGQDIEVDGNYYWGGDYTYHTDINNDEVDTANRRYNSTETYSTGTKYYYVYRGSHNSGFNLGGYSNLKLMNANTFTINALDSNVRSKNTNIAVYIPDGEIYYWEVAKNKTNYTSLEQNVSTRANMRAIMDAANGTTNGTIGGVGVEGLNRYWNINLATDWIGLKDNSTYYAVMKQDQDTNMITLTSVDAIQIATPEDEQSTASGGPFYSTSNDGAQGYFGSVKYPTKTYNLYCGYIPAIMDAWSNGSSRGNGNIARKDDWDSYNFQQLGVNERSAVRNDDNAYNADNLFYIGSNTSSKVANDFGSWPRWKGTYGLVPYVITGSDISYGGFQSAMELNIKGGNFITGYNYWNFDIAYYPFTNVMYAPLGKAFDSKTPITSQLVGDFVSIIPKDASRLVVPEIYENGGVGYNQRNVTGGQIIDITMSYLSHPLAIARTMNPTDDKVFDQANDKGGNRIFYWNNSREAATYLDCASTMVPSGEDDIPVSMMVGYITGGLAEYTGGGTGDDAFVNAVFNNGIVLLRAGTSNTGTQSSDNVSTGEDKATDSIGYRLDSESNAFHQFYYLNSRSNVASKPNRGTYNHIGNLGGAMCWFNNKHIQYISTDGTDAATSSTTSSTYSYLRSHPLANTKVNCVTWGTSWSMNPVAMWGTENGTLLSWKCEKYDDDNDGQTVANNSDDKGFNDRSVYAEFQSYQWVENVNNKTFKVHDSRWAGTVGSSSSYQTYYEDNKTQKGQPFSIGSDYYFDFYDSCSRLRSKEGYNYGLNVTTYPLESINRVGGDKKGLTYESTSWGSFSGIEWKAFGFISTLNSVNDVAYNDDTWVAVGDQSDKAPKTYCGETKSTDLSGTTVEAYSGTGEAASYVNVCYWIDTNKDANHKQTSTNRNYQWKAVKISDEKYCNIVQINNVNGMWIATGYLDADKDGEYDDGEKARIFWTYDPRLSCDQAGGWSDNVKMYDGTEEKSLDEMGGINSVATRD